MTNSMLVPRRLAPLRAPVSLVGSVLVLMLAAALTSCAADAPTETPDSGTPSPSDAPAAQPATFYFALNQPGRLTLIGETQEVESAGTLLDDALAGLIDGSVQPVDPDYENLWGDGTELRSAEVEGDTLTVDLAMGSLNVGAEGETRAIDQILWTANAIEPTIEYLAITVDGEVVETLAGHVDTTVVFRRPPAESLLNPVQVDSPAEGDEVSGAVVASGLACAFEAIVAWELSDDAGAEVTSGTTMAAEACPVRSPWQVDLGELEPGDYVFSAIQYSLRDGSVASVDDKRFTVTG